MWDDPQVKHLGIRQPMTHPEKANAPSLATDPYVPYALAHAQYYAGCREHTDEILRSLGYDDAAISKLHADKVV